MARYELSDGKSNKFWEITCDGAEVTTRWGRIGSDGQAKTKVFASLAKAEAEVDKQTTTKQAKGYRQASADGAAPVESPMREGAMPEGEPAGVSVSGDLADGEQTQVAGSGGRSYTVRNVGGVFSCSCPAWRNQSVPIEGRTCKHLRRFRGDAAETARLGALPVRSSATPEEGPPLLLAQTWDPAVHDPTGWWMSEKLDGVRALWDGNRFVSRLGREFRAPDWFTAALPDEPLDGELFVGRGLFHRTVSIVRRVDRGEGWRDLRFLVFDAPEARGGFEERLGRMRELAQHWTDAFAAALDHEVCPGFDALQAELTRVESLGGEGLMLRQPGSAYIAGRSDTLLKVKRFLEAEARVVAHLAGAGRHKGRLGACRAELPDGTLFKVGTGFSDAQREEPPPVGAVITVRYQELTRAGVPRFPSFLRVRTDMDWDDVLAAVQGDD